MMRELRNIEQRLLPRGWADAARQVLLFAAAYYAYQIVRGTVDGKVAVAAWNATKVISVERRLHVFIEPTLQAGRRAGAASSDAASWMYINAQTSVTLGGAGLPVPVPQPASTSCATCS